MTQLLALWKGIQEKKGETREEKEKEDVDNNQEKKKVPVYSAR